MKAAVWYQKEDIRIEDVPEPSPGKGQVKVKINACGICGSDLHEFRQGPFIIPARPHTLTGRQGGPVNTFHHTQYGFGNCHNRSRITGRYHGLGLFLFN